MTGEAAIAAAFAERAAGIREIKAALDYDPEKLPPAPSATLSFIGLAEREVGTGLVEVEWRWVLRVRVPLKSGQGSDFRRAQRALGQLMPEIYRVLRADKTLGDTCIKAAILESNEEPDYDTESKRATKELFLVALTEEPLR